MKAKEFDSLFDNGEDISQYLDINKAQHPRRLQSLQINLPFWLIEKLVQKAKQEGISPDNLIENYLTEHLI